MKYPPIINKSWAQKYFDLMYAFYKDFSIIHSNKISTDFLEKLKYNHFKNKYHFETAIDFSGEQKLFCQLNHFRQSYTPALKTTLGSASRYMTLSDCMMKNIISEKSLENLGFPETKAFLNSIGFFARPQDKAVSDESFHKDIDPLAVNSCVIS